MDWRSLGKQSFSRVTGCAEFTKSLSRNVIAIDVDSRLKKDTWNRSGEIVQVISVPIFPQGLVVANSLTKLEFHPTLVRFQIENNNLYKLRFKPVPWLTEFTLSIWQYYGD